AVIDRQGAERVDRDLAAGVVDGAAGNDGQRAAAQNLDQAVVVDALGVELVGGAAGVDGAVIGQGAVAQSRRLDQSGRAGLRAVARVPYTTLFRSAVIDRQGAERVDRDLAAGVVDGAAGNDGQRAAAQNLDQAVVVDALGVELVGGAAGVDGAVIGQG